ncbi:uncharacterized protein K452DRAFT_54111 [Aplosporella prunicola CBS 121167]|uniref:Uncharacterized protein n=1 Tax=Aplosporella prunicola CBS 121167 TaxID=1176127 RepID=A0A6A6B842_9PEZI|nr:uncharacterized protein K452DRAFT_54111 [Aplosporella prunicola CBS 121167]KAF2140319.1 hypothetical protein K452DRAFT_54111 [Aplosporella prunicola CBS 121167]
MHLLHLTHLHRFQLLTIHLWCKTVFTSLFLMHVLSIDTSLRASSTSGQPLVMIMERASKKIHCLSAKDCWKPNKCRIMAIVPNDSEIVARVLQNAWLGDKA